MRGRARTAGTDGQAAVEVALVLPLVALLLLLIVQAGSVVRDQVLVVHAAREAARAAAVDPSPGAARQAAAAAADLDPRRLDVRVDPGGPGRPLAVTVRYRPTPAAPLVGALVRGILLEGHASMRREF